MKKFKIIVLISSVALFIVSLTQKCFCTDDSCGDSAAVLVSGFFGVFICPAGFTWLANPSILTSWITFNKKPVMSLITGLIAVILSVSFLFFRRIVANEGGSYSTIISYKLGYWLWTASSSIMLIGNTIFYFCEKRDPGIKVIDRS